MPSHSGPIAGRFSFLAPLRTDAERWRLAVALIASLGAHAALINVRVPAAPILQGDSVATAAPMVAIRLDATLRPRGDPRLAVADGADDRKQIQAPVSSAARIATDGAAWSDPALPGTTVRAPKSPASRLAGYFPADALDVRPLNRSRPTPQYPEDVPPGTLARVGLRVLVSAQGRVDDAIVIESSGTPAFDAAARTAFADARYRPGEIAGRNVPSQIDIEVWFGSAPRGTARLEMPTPMRPAPIRPKPAREAKETPPTPRPRRAP